MTPTTDFAALGLLQQLQPSIMALVGTLLFILVAVWFARSLTAKAQAAGNVTAEEATATRGTVRTVAWYVVAFVLIAFTWHSVTTVVINRTPHTELDGSAVYDQMQKNTQPKQ
jgi:hypothetical protein